IGYGMTNPAASQILMGSTPAKYRNIVFSLKQTGVPFGGIFAGLAVPAINQNYNWQAAPVLGAILCVSLLIMIQPMRKRWETPIKSDVTFSLESFRGLKLCLTNNNLFWLSVAGLFFGGVQLCLVTFAVTMLVSEVGFTLVAAGAVLASLQMAGIVGRLFFGFAADKLLTGKHALMLMSTINIFGALSVYQLDASWSVWIIYMIFVIFGSCALGWTGIIQAEAVSNAPLRHSGAVIGALSVPMFGGVIFGPAVFSMLVSYTQSYSNAFLLLVLFARSSFICLGMLSSRQQFKEEISTID
ncbi:MAG: MFS transporter, partial [Desulfobulbia bacterium]